MFKSMHRITKKFRDFAKEFETIRICCTCFPVIHICNVIMKDLMYVNTHEEIWKNLKWYEKLKWHISFWLITITLFSWYYIFSYVITFFIILSIKLISYFKKANKYKI